MSFSQRDTKEFEIQKRNGKRGELFILENWNLLVANDQSKATIRAAAGADQIEGKDLLLSRVAGNTGLVVETKTIKFFLSRNRPSGGTGSLYFEVLNSSGTEAGWLYQMLFGRSQKPDINKPTPMIPDALAFLLVSTPDGNPFSSIIFEDFATLASRLSEEAQKWGWNPSDQSAWDPIKLKSFRANETIEKCGQRIDGGGMNKQRERQGYLWHVPFDELTDIATVTMIGNPPMLETKNHYYISEELLRSTQETRLAYLKEVSQGRHIPSAALAKNAENKRLIESHPKRGKAWGLDSRTLELLESLPRSAED